MDLTQIARLLAVLGIVLLITAGVFYLFSRSGVPFGKMPGDIQIIRENFSCTIPLVSSLLASVILTLLFNLLISVLKK